MVRYEKKTIEVSLDHPSLTLVEELNQLRTDPIEGPSVSIPIVAVRDNKQERVAIEKFLSQLGAQKKEDAKASAPPAPPAKVVPDVTTVPPIPRTYIQFVQDWKRLSQQSEMQYQYLKVIEQRHFIAMKGICSAYIDRVSFSCSKSRPRSCRTFSASHLNQMF